MNTDDFHYMYRGKVVRDFEQTEADLLADVDIKRHDSGRALLLFHGFSSSPAIYRELIPSLTMYDKIWCPILPGHAESIEAFANSKASEWVNTALESYQKLTKNYDEIDIMGLSLGGLLASIVASTYKPNHLYLLAPALALRGMTNLLLFCAKVLQFLGFKQISNKAGNFYTDKYQELTYKKLPIHAIIEILTLVKNNKFIMPNCDTDLFLGRHDEVVNSKLVAKLFEPSSNTKIHWLNNSAHLLPLDGDIDEILACILKNENV